MYYKLLGLHSEPFSTSPDPRFFYRSQGHQTALQRLEINIRLRRGMSLVYGDVGTGKTTLSRILMQEMAEDEEILFFLILDPGFSSEYDFVSRLTRMFGLKIDSSSVIDHKDAIERYLFRQGVECGKTVVLLIDEGQKLIDENLELLRTLLNYETNEYKLLQLVLLAQMELKPRIDRIHNFLDRVAFTAVLEGLDETDTAKLIRFRLETAGYPATRPLFTPESITLIRKYTGGYPRKIAMLCHDALQFAIGREKVRVEAEDVEAIAEQKGLKA
jgi:general secretion pathway protein A